MSLWHYNFASKEQIKVKNKIWILNLRFHHQFFKPSRLQQLTLQFASFFFFPIFIMCCMHNVECIEWNNELEALGDDTWTSYFWTYYWQFGIWSFPICHLLSSTPMLSFCSRIAIWWPYLILLRWMVF
jgi:hypothetical protein